MTWQISDVHIKNFPTIYCKDGETYRRESKYALSSNSKLFKKILAHGEVSLKLIVICIKQTN